MPLSNQGKIKMKKWKDLAPHKTGCLYKGVAVHGYEAEITHSGFCIGFNVPVKWEEKVPGK